MLNYTILKFILNFLKFTLSRYVEPKQDPNLVNMNHDFDGNVDNSKIVIKWNKNYKKAKIKE